MSCPFEKNSLGRNIFKGSRGRSICFGLMTLISEIGWISLTQTVVSPTLSTIVTPPLPPFGERAFPQSSSTLSRFRSPAPFLAVPPLFFLSPFPSPSLSFSPKVQPNLRVPREARNVGDGSVAFPTGRADFLTLRWFWSRKLTRKCRILKKNI